MNKILRDFIREREKKNSELWKAFYESRKPMEEIMKKWMDAREEMNKPMREYLYEQWRKELYE